MDTNIVFDAPWALSLKITTGLSLFILIAIPVIFFSYASLANDLGRTIIILFLPMFILIGASLFIIRGYVITSDSIIVKQLGWSKKFDLDKLKSIKFDPNAMAASVRTFGNGGIFSYVGRFSNNSLGSYRAYATNPSLSVILYFKDETIVLTPDRPEYFVSSIYKITELNVN